VVGYIHFHARNFVEDTNPSHNFAKAQSCSPHLFEIVSRSQLYLFFHFRSESTLAKYLVMKMLSFATNLGSESPWCSIQLQLAKISEFH
jgi:hypothetical protein